MPESASFRPLLDQENMDSRILISGDFFFSGALVPLAVGSYVCIFCTIFEDRAGQAMMIQEITCFECN